MLVSITDRRKSNPSFPSGLMRRMGYQDALDGRRREHGSPEYNNGYDEGIKAIGRKAT